MNLNDNDLWSLYRKMSGQIRPAPHSLCIRLWPQQNHSEMGDEQHCGCMRKAFWIYNTSILQVYRAVELMMFSKTAALRSRPLCSTCLNVGDKCFCVYWLTPTGLFWIFLKTTPTLVNHFISSSLTLNQIYILSLLMDANISTCGVPTLSWSAG